MRELFIAAERAASLEFQKRMKFTFFRERERFSADAAIKRFSIISYEQINLP
jgi:hypothetical protein